MGKKAVKIKLIVVSGAYGVFAVCQNFPAISFLCIKECSASFPI